MKKFLILLIVILALFFLLNYVNSSKKPVLVQQPVQTQNSITGEVKIIAENLQIPWEILFLPGGEILITERPGNLVIIGKERKTLKVSDVEAVGEGGLLGAALHPNFPNNHFLYLYFTTRTDGRLENRVERFIFENEKLTDGKIITEGIAAAANHNGGRIAFGPDGYLYVATGDAQNEKLAQDQNSLNGKILRVKDDGSGLEIYSYGHRNVQGLAWDNEGRLWATEHGRSGIASGYDELNLIEKGKNYGWPVIEGDEEKEGMVSPVIQSGASETWAPAGLAYFNGRLFFGGLRGETLYEYQISQKLLKRHLVRQFGRIRAVVLKDNNLYLTTSNTDGRGRVRDRDDKLIIIGLD